MTDRRTERSIEEKKAQTAAANEARRLPEGMISTKPYKFTLTRELAEELEKLDKADRDKAMSLGLKMSRRHRKR